MFGAGARRARLESVGKRAGGERTPQLRINERLIRLARDGLRVVRLKGGDPLVFGRGAEEALALAAAGVRFHTSSGDQRRHRRDGGGRHSGHASRSGAQRRFCHRTRHERRVADDVTWTRPGPRCGCARALHGVGRMARSRFGCSGQGAKPRNRWAFVTEATTSRQSVQVTTLAQAAAIAADIPRDVPTLIIVGPVVALRPLIAAWQDAAPMSCVPVSQRATA